MKINTPLLNRHFCAVVFSAFLFAGAAQAEKSTLNLFIWSEYIDPQIVSAFEKQFDCKVNIDLYEDVDSMLAKIQGGGAGLYDVVVPSDNLVPVMMKQNLLAPLRHENIPNLKNLGENLSVPPTTLKTASPSRINGALWACWPGKRPANRCPIRGPAFLILPNQLGPSC